MPGKWVMAVLLAGLAGLAIGLTTGQWIAGEEGAGGEDTGPPIDPQPVVTVRLGWVERAMILPNGLALHAKLDSGAKRTSLNAVNLRFFKRNDRRWVRFAVINREGVSTMLEREVVGEVKVKRFLGRQLVRPLIQLQLCVGGVLKEVAVSLQDRTGFDHPLLIGRTFMAGSIVVDPGARYVGEPVCAGGARG